METYLLVNIFILSLVILALRMTKVTKGQLLTMVLLIIITAVGDSVIIGLGIVGYDVHKILGVFVGLAPIEDFFYAISAALLIPTIWHKLERHND